jgi:cytochrome b561
MGLNNETCAALVFLILYTILFVLLFLGYTTGRIRVRSRYSLIMFHVTVRLASQATGVAFGIVGYSATNLLVAYFILYVYRFQVFRDMLKIF